MNAVRTENSFTAGDFSSADFDTLLRSVQIRMATHRMLLATSRNLLVALLAAMPLVAFAAVRARPPAALPVTGLCTVALIAAAVEAVVMRPDRFRAAEYLDRRCGLKERLSTYCSRAFDSAAAPVKQALANDALRHARTISPAEACPLVLPKTAPFTGAAAFCAIILLFGAAQRSTAGNAAIENHELEEIMSAGPERIELALPPSLQGELEELIADGTSKLDDVAARIQNLLNQYDALKNIRQISETLQLDELDAAGIEEMLKNQPDAKQQLKAALDDALRRIRDARLRESLAEAVELLESGDEAQAASALQALLEELATQVAEHDTAQLEMLGEHLAAVRGQPISEHDGGTVGRILESDGDSILSGDTPPDMLFPPSAVLKARAAVDAGSVPARYQWIVETYFSTDFESTPEREP